MSTDIRSSRSHAQAATNGQCDRSFTDHRQEMTGCYEARTRTKHGQSSISKEKGPPTGASEALTTELLRMVAGACNAPKPPPWFCRFGIVSLARWRHEPKFSD